MALQYDKGPRDWQNLFASYIMRFCYIEVLFPIFYYFCGKANCLLYRGQVHYSKVPVYKAKRQWVLKIIRRDIPLYLSFAVAFCH